MGETASVWSVLLVALCAANWPFFSERLLLVGPSLRPRKALRWRVLELLLLWLLTMGIGMALEAGLGQRHPQPWEFYAAFGFLFLTFAFPGFVWRYLRRGA